MAWRIGSLLWGLLGTVGLVLYATDGRLAPAQVVEGLAVLGVLLALFVVVKLPWDLYFAARNVQRTQADATGRKVAVPDTDRLETARLARRLLALCLGLHVLGAVLAGGALQLTGGSSGPWVAGAFLLSMGLRPTVAMVQHVRRRLQVLQRRAKVPLDDAVALAQRLKDVEKRVRRLYETVEHDHTGLLAVHGRTEALAHDLDARMTDLDHRQRKDLDRVMVEVERTIEKLTRDQEILAGLRAFLHMVRTT